jgi:hypothetical protein
MLFCGVQGGCTFFFFFWFVVVVFVICKRSWCQRRKDGTKKRQQLFSLTDRATFSCFLGTPVALLPKELRLLVVFGGGGRGGCRVLNAGQLLLARHLLTSFFGRLGSNSWVNGEQNMEQNITTTKKRGQLYETCIETVDGQEECF